MRYLSDSEILNWSDRLDTRLALVPVFNNRVGYPDIRVISQASMGNEHLDTSEIKIRYSFSFSVTKNRLREFFEIKEKLFKKGFGTNIVYGDRIIKPEPSSSDICSITESTHTVYNREFVRYEYNFSGKIGDIIACVSLLEDTISYFSLIWAYDKEGREICQIKYPIASIVSLIEDKSKDYLVIDYDYYRVNNTDYKIDYIISEIISDSKSIIKYGVTNIQKEDRLCFSRNSRIDNILN
jgi:hypothetical protein